MMSEEWIAWGGGEMPVPRGTRVDVRRRGGNEDYYVLAGSDAAGTDGEYWCDDGCMGDIVAYRVVEPSLAGDIPRRDPDARGGNPRKRQVGGDHYRRQLIQPWEAMEAWMPSAEFTGFLRGNVIKYMARAGHKGERLENFQKAHHYLEKLLELERSTLSRPTAPADPSAGDGCSGEASPGSCGQR